MNQTQSKLEAEAAFIKRLERLDTGELAHLRRAAGDRLCDHPKNLWFLGLVHGVAKDEVAFLVATLLAQYSTLKIKDGKHRIEIRADAKPGTSNFGETWKRAIAGSPDNKSIRRRFHILLDSELTSDGGGDLPYRLRQMVRYAASKNVGVDWSQLLRDLSWWQNAEHRIQKNWARTFFVDAPKDQEDSSK